LSDVSLRNPPRSSRSTGPARLCFAGPPYMLASSPSAPISGLRLQEDKGSMSRTLGTFSARLAQTRKLPLRLRIAALGEGLSACSPEESEALALELLELAILPAFDSST